MDLRRDRARMAAWAAALVLLLVPAAAPAQTSGDHDGDADGYPASQDCNDADPRVYPDAFEVPRNGVDENCDGIDLRWLRSRDRYSWILHRRSAELALLVVSVPRDAYMLVSCSGRGCPPRRELRGTFRGRVAARRVHAARYYNLATRFRGYRLRPGARIYIRVTAADAIGKFIEFRVRSRGAPVQRVGCLGVDGRSEVKCPT